MALWVRLNTAYFAENWKYCNKIIFKCVNSVVGSIFNIYFFLNKVVVDSVNSALCLLPTETRALKKTKTKKCVKTPETQTQTQGR